MTHAHMLLVAASAYSSTPTASDSLRALRFRPPAIPLFTTDPFTQTWMRGDTSTSAAVTHWTGTEKQLTGLVRVDGKAYTFLGNSTGSPPLVQRAMVAFPTRTAFELELPGVLALNLTFLSTMFTDDFPRLSRPVYYLAHEARALDGRAHEVQLYLDASAQHAVNTEDEPVAWASADADGFRAVRLGTAAQAVLGSKGDRVNIDWGQLLLGAPAGVIASVWAGSASASRTAFARSGSLPASPDSRQPRPCSDDLPALSLSRDLGEVGGAAVRHVAILAYDDTESVYFFGGRMKGLWTQHWSSITAAMAAAAAEYQPMLDKSVAHDEALLADTRAAGGDKYMALCALAYRQTLAATKLVWNPALKAPWNFLKEISTNGDMQTMDVIYPASPMLLHTSPELLRLLLLPVLAYANNETFIRFSNPYSPHQLGTYPIANATTAQQEPMPLENSGNMLLMLLGIVQRQGAASAKGWLLGYWPMLVSWVEELKRSLPFPANQICTDDFTGPLANNTNLGLKGIVAIEAFAELCRLLQSAAGDRLRTDCDSYSAVATRYSAVWQRYAFEPAPAPHYKMSYNAVKGVTDSWSFKYNLLWQKLLKLSGPFPDTVASREVAYYRMRANPFGTPMDPRHTYVKTDWLSWVAALGDDEDFHALFEPIFKFANATPSRNPFTDLYDTKSGNQTWGGFIARPVIGGLFAKLLL